MPPVHTTVPWLVRADPGLTTFWPPVDSVSVCPVPTSSPPVSDTIPPVHVAGPSSVTFPLPVSVSDKLRPPASAASPAMTSDPVTTMYSVEYNDCTAAVVVRTVTTKFPAGRSITTTSPLPGITPPLQFAGSSQNPLVSTIHSARRPPTATTARPGRPLPIDAVMTAPPEVPPVTGIVMLVCPEGICTVTGTAATAALELTSVMIGFTPPAVPPAGSDTVNVPPAPGDSTSELGDSVTPTGDVRIVTVSGALTPVPLLTTSWTT